MVLRKYLQGALIESIEQVENDRIVEMTVSNKNEIGDHIQATLIIEIMGKHSNILLVDKSSHKILEVIKHVGFHKIATVPCCLDRPISLRQVRNHSILSPSRMKSSLKSYKHRKRQLKIFKASFKVWDAIRQMNWKTFWLMKNFPLSETFSIKKPNHAWLRLPSAQFLLQIRWESLLPVFLICWTPTIRIRLNATASNSKPVNSFRRVENELQKTPQTQKTRKRGYWRQTTLNEFRQKGEIADNLPPPST